MVEDDVKGGIEDDVEGGGGFVLPVSESKVSHLVVTEAALPESLKGLAFLAFRESSAST